MRILGLPKIEEFKRSHADARRSLDAWRLVVQVRYRNGLVVVEWIGTHAEYSKKRF